ncbi:hypothetical protein FHS31_001059 [Sphingomonas vulcanisoli]|uniref:DUF5666 domain-containing protein n=1 Tax=Sphingomonas vulcanisoli TaxID=1658060 RepID=A0ABX0TPK1_9SPHN|nr:hypothetical protein [Sphingomonas vulcanisoli]NIJ07463.1 hypothetical protein [Sphingomonas vulcanisoli]
MTKFLLPLLALTAAAPAFASQPAADVQTISFERDGVAYVGTVKKVGDQQVISGHEVESGRAFDLVVRNGRVSGTYAAQPINYTVAQK